MDIDWTIKLGLLGLLLLGSAFFSGSEVALFSIDKKKVESKFASNNIIRRYLLSLINFPRRQLVTILIGNTIVNVAASIIGVALAFESAKYFNISVDLALIIQIILLTILILFFGELLPKVTATKNPLKFSKYIAIPLFYFNIVVYPIAEFITELIRLSVVKLKFDRSKTAISQDEIPELAKMSHEIGALETDEHNLIHGLVSFGSVTVEEIMTPRVDIVAFSDDIAFEEMLQVVTESGHSRFPLYNENLDTIVGVIFAKDILPFIKKDNPTEKVPLSKIARNTLFVPEKKLISEVLQEFQERNMHLAIAVDEYGGTSGIVTLEDIIEEVLGEIWDEHDDEEDQFIEIGKDNYIVLGKVSIDEINEKFNLNIDTEEEFDTLGGFIFHKAGSIPHINFSFRIDDYKLTVKEVHNKRVKKVLLEKLSEDIPEIK